MAQIVDGWSLGFAGDSKEVCQYHQLTTCAAQWWCLYINKSTKVRGIQFDTCLWRPLSLLICACVRQHLPTKTFLLIFPCLGLASPDQMDEGIRRGNERLYMDVDLVRMLISIEPITQASS